jgi:hypothetical protein
VDLPPELDGSDLHNPHPDRVSRVVLGALEKWILLSSYRIFDEANSESFDRDSMARIPIVYKNPSQTASDRSPIVHHPFAETKSSKRLLDRRR